MSPFIGKIFSHNKYKCTIQIFVILGYFMKDKIRVRPCRRSIRTYTRRSTSPTRSKALVVFTLILTTVGSSRADSISKCESIWSRMKPQLVYTLWRYLIHNRFVTSYLSSTNCDVLYYNLRDTEQKKTSPSK